MPTTTPNALPDSMSAPTAHRHRAPLPNADPDHRLDALSRLVGNTPLAAIDFDFRGQRRTVCAKLESMNMTGSVKDRMALHILRRGYANGSLRPGALIVEATSGNTGISFAALGRALGHTVAIFMPDWMSTERINLMRSLGAEVHLVPREEGGFLGAIARATALAAATPGAFLPRQFSNEDNSQAHQVTTGPELLAQFAFGQLVPDTFVAGVGTGGTVMGVARYLKSRVPSIRVHPLEPASSPTLTTGHKTGTHRIQGISDEFVPPIVDLAFLDEVIAVHDGDAILMAQQLASSLGLAVGISSGANFLGAVLAQNALGPRAVAATVFPDSNKKYLSTDLMGYEPVKPAYLSPHIRLREFRVLARQCEFCPSDVRDAAGLR